MKKWITILTAAVLALSLFAGCTSSDSKGMTIEKGKLIMSTNAESPPCEMTDDNGSYVGIDIEIAKAIADKLGLELVIDDMGFVAALVAGFSLPLSAIAGSALGAGVIVAALAVQAAAAVLEGLSAKSVKAAN